jgi:hypothetical protein
VKIQIKTDDGKVLKITNARQILVTDTKFNTPLYVAEEVMPQAVTHCAIQPGREDEFKETLIQLGLALPPHIQDINPDLLL